jgi:fido (protein-threonine AMPylation protein)
MRAPRALSRCRPTCCDLGSAVQFSRFFPLSWIHPFANGNGRHSSMIADVIAVKYERPELTWGTGQNLVVEGKARDT